MNPGALLHKNHWLKDRVESTIKIKFERKINKKPREMYFKKRCSMTYYGAESQADFEFTCIGFKKTTG